MMKLNEMLNRVSHTVPSTSDLFMLMKKLQGPESVAKVDVHVSIHDKSPEGPQLGASSGTLLRSHFKLC
jgi:hypothetical protein